MAYGVQNIPARPRRAGVTLLLLGLAAGCQSTEKHPPTSLPVRPQVGPQTGQQPATRTPTPASPAGTSNPAGSPTAARPAAGDRRDTSPVLTNDRFTTATPPVVSPVTTPAQPGAAGQAMTVPGLSSSGGSLYPRSQPTASGPASAVPPASVSAPGPDATPPIPLPPQGMMVGTKVDPPTPSTTPIVPPAPPATPLGPQTGSPAVFDPPAPPQPINLPSR